MKFVIVHGAFGTHNENWFPDTKKFIESHNHEVIAPDFPVDSWNDLTTHGLGNIHINQSLHRWLEVFKPIAKTFKSSESLCFVGHSLGPVFILHAVETFNIQLDSAIFVSPFLEKLNGLWQIDAVNESFYSSNFDFVKLKTLIPRSFVLHSDNDPYVPVKYSVDFAHKLNSSIIEVRGAGHFNSEFGFHSLPIVNELCVARMGYVIKKR